MYCRTNQRRGGEEYTLSRACGVVSFLLLERLLPDLAASFPFPLLFSTRCFIYPSVALHSLIFVCGEQVKKPLGVKGSFLVALDFLLFLINFSRRNHVPHSFTTPPCWLGSTLCSTPTPSIASLVRSPSSTISFQLEKKQRIK